VAGFTQVAYSMAKIYTRTGDSGETSLLGGQRLPKYSSRVEAIGSVDEVNASIGLVRVELTRSGVAPAGMDELLAGVQHRLFEVGAELAATKTADRAAGTLGDADVHGLELAIDRWEAGLEPLRQFILPGGAAAAAQLHQARCVCRRAERRLAKLSAEESLRGELLRYLNRLSDLLFVLARVVNRANRVPDVVWPGAREQGPGGESTGQRQASNLGHET
jgi:cob(I)alamin adenosyltransferase